MEKPTTDEEIREILIKRLKKQGVGSGRIRLPKEGEYGGIERLVNYFPVDSCEKIGIDTDLLPFLGFPFEMVWDEESCYDRIKRIKKDLEAEGIIMVFRAKNGDYIEMYAGN